VEAVARMLENTALIGTGQYEVIIVRNIVTHEQKIGLVMFNRQCSRSGTALNRIPPAFCVGKTLASP
jgi:hypothetical protein